MNSARHSDNRSIDELIADQKPGYSLDQRFYTDPDIYALELDSKGRMRQGALNPRLFARLDESYRVLMRQGRGRGHVGPLACI